MGELRRSDHTTTGCVEMLPRTYLSKEVSRRKTTHTVCLGALRLTRGCGPRRRHLRAVTPSCDLITSDSHDARAIHDGPITANMRAASCTPRSP
jgi:hypothetical protein